MTRLEDFWEDLFQEPIDEVSKMVMEGVYQYVDQDEQLAILAAIPTYMLGKVLLRDPASPFQIAAKLGQSMKELEAALTRMNVNSVGMQKRLEGLNENLFKVHILVEMAARLANDLKRQNARKQPVPILKLDADHRNQSWSYALDPEAMRQIGKMVVGACIVSSLFSAAVTATLLIWIL